MTTQFRTITIQEGDGTESQIQVPIATSETVESTPLLPAIGASDPAEDQTIAPTPSTLRITPSGLADDQTGPESATTIAAPFKPEEFRLVTVEEGDGTVSQILVPITPAISPTVTTVAETAAPTPLTTITPQIPRAPITRVVEITEGSGEKSKIAVELNPVTLPVARVAPALLTTRGETLLERHIARIDEGTDQPFVAAVQAPELGVVTRAKVSKILGEISGAARLFDVTSPQTEFDRLVDRATEAVVLLNKDPYSAEAAGIITELVIAGQSGLASKVFELTKDRSDFEKRVIDIEPKLQKAALDLNLSDRAAILLMDMPFNALSESQRAVRLELVRRRGGLDGPALTKSGQQLADALTEALTFGKAETRTFNDDDIRREYAKLRTDASKIYDEAVNDAKVEGTVITLAKEDYLATALPSEDEYVETVIASMPKLRELAKEAGKASIPLYGTVYTWENDPNWARALSIAGDLATFLPVLGLAAGFTRAGVGFKSAAKAIAIAELKAPFTPILAPGRVVRAGLETVEELNDIFRTVVPGPLGGARKIPVSVTEVTSSTTTRIPIREGRTAKFGVIPVEGEIPRGLASPEGFAIREELTQKTIYGDVNPQTGLAEVAFGEGTIGVPVPILQQVTEPALISSTKDGRNWMAGLVIGEQATQKQGGAAYFAGGRMQRFVDNTSSGRDIDLSTKAAAAVALGDLPPDAVKSVIIVKQSSPFFQLAEDSKKTYAGTLELERIIEPKAFKTRAEAFDQVKLWEKRGAKGATYEEVDKLTGKVTYFAGPEFPTPDQVLFQRNVFTGEKNLVLVFGNPYTRTQMTKLKLLGPWENMKQILTPGEGFFRADIGDKITEAKALSNEAAELYQESRVALAAGRIDDARDLERRGDAKLISADGAIQRANVNQFVESTFTAGATYTGDQDIETGLRALGGEIPPTISTAELRAAGEAPPVRVPGEPSLVGVRGVPVREGVVVEERPRAPGAGEIEDLGIVGPPPRPPAERRELEPEDITPPPRRPVAEEDDVRIPPPAPLARIPGEIPEDRVPPPPVEERLPPPPPEAREAIPPDPTLIRLALPGAPDKKKRREEEKKRLRGYTWLQGRVYVSVRPPYAEKDIAYDFRKPVDTVMVRGPVQAWDSIQRDGFTIDVDTLDEWAEWFTASPELKESRMTTPPDEFAEFDEQAQPVQPVQPGVQPARAPRRRAPTRIEVEVVPVSPRRAIAPVGAAGAMAAARRAPRIRQGGFSWPMGNIYIGVYPPFTEDDIVYDVTPPGGTVSVRGPREAWNRIKKLGFEPDASTYDEWAAWFTAKGEATGIEGAILGNTGSAFEPQEGGLKAFEPSVDEFFNPKNVDF